MRYRTTALDIIRFAWTLWRLPKKWRRHLRIGQAILNAMPPEQEKPCYLYYADNRDLIARLRGDADD